MKKRSLLFMALAVVVQMGFTQNWQVQPKDTRISFKIKNFGLWVEGSLTGIQAQIQFDPTSPASGKM
jgi:polyisoprenoid-binding protein YceI